jgi:hypothetical protein
MKEFKIGDKVKVIADLQNYPYPKNEYVGRFGSICAIGENSICFDEDNVGHLPYDFLPAELALIEETEPEEEPLFEGKYWLGISPEGGSRKTWIGNLYEDKYDASDFTGRKDKILRVSVKEIRD